jgi:hypothetical protein
VYGVRFDSAVARAVCGIQLSIQRANSNANKIKTTTHHTMRFNFLKLNQLSKYDHLPSFFQASCINAMYVMYLRRRYGLTVNLYNVRMYVR